MFSFSRFFFFRFPLFEKRASRMEPWEVQVLSDHWPRPGTYWRGHYKGRGGSRAQGLALFRKTLRLGQRSKGFQSSTENLHTGGLQCYTTRCKAVPVKLGSSSPILQTMAAIVELLGDKRSTLFTEKTPLFKRLPLTGKGCGTPSDMSRNLHARPVLQIITKLYC